MFFFGGFFFLLFTSYQVCSYVIYCALHPSKIDHGHEVNWLSELREVSVLFINLEPGEQLNASGTLNLLQSSFDVVYPSLTKYDGRLLYLPKNVLLVPFLLAGSLNKVFMFDKVFSSP